MSDPADTNLSSGQIEPSVSSVPPRSGLSVVLRLTLLFGTTLAVLLAVLLTVGWVYSRKIREAQIYAHLETVANIRRAMVRTEVDLLRQRVEVNADRGEFRGYLFTHSAGGTTTSDAAQMTLNRLAKRKPIIHASIVTPEGKILLTSDPLELGRDIHEWSAFQSAKIGPHVGQPRTMNGRNVAYVSAPIRGRDDEKRLFGVLLLLADVSELETAVRDTTGLGQTGEVLLGKRDGEQLHLLFPPRNAPQTATVPLDSAPALRDATAGVSGFYKDHDYRGVAVLAASRPIGFDGWGMVLKMDQHEAFAPLQRALRLGIFAGFLVATGGLLVAYILAMRFTRPLRRLTQAAGRIAEGDYATTVPVESTDEFGSLSTNFNDMTTAIRARGEARDQAEAALREADRRKDEFIAVLGHELRNPLSAIAHSVQVIEASGDDPEADEAARGVIVRQTENLMRLVDDLLDVARISKGKIELRKRPVEIGQSILRVVEAVRPLLDEKQHTLDLALSNGDPIWIEADPTRFDQILTNLLVNAAKYTPDGGRITITRRGEERDVVIAIKDTGIGIAPEMLARIFELFTQVDCSLDHRTGGLGIGLNLSRALVELHGGIITAQSSGLGQGAIFTLRFPIVDAPAPAALTTPASPRSRPGPSRRVLLVDDNEDTVHSMARLLKMRGHEIAVAFDGLAALQVAHEFRPDFIALDLGLPGLDGYTLARRLRAEGFTETPIAAVSGYAQESDRARSREAGIDYHFAKPVDIHALAELIVETPVSQR